MRRPASGGKSSRSSAGSGRKVKGYVLSVSNSGYPASLEVRKVYEYWSRWRMIPSHASVPWTNPATTTFTRELSFAASPSLGRSSERSSGRTPPPGLCGPLLATGLSSFHRDTASRNIRSSEDRSRPRIAYLPGAGGRKGRPYGAEGHNGSFLTPTRPPSSWGRRRREGCPARGRSC
jgi:hypothetical protein